MPESFLWLLNHVGNAFTLSTRQHKFSQLSDSWQESVSVKRLSSSSWCVWALGQDHRVYIYIFYSDVPIRVPVTLYENQRWIPLSGFSQKRRFPSDRPAWSDEKGLKDTPKESFRLPSAHWEWETDWMVDENLRGEVAGREGWQYAVDFPSLNYTPDPHWQSCVRKRKWIRFRRFTSTDVWVRVSDEEVVENAECFIDISVGGFLLPSQPPGFLLVWAVTNNGHVLVRANVHQDNPEGDCWQDISLGSHLGVINISMGASNLLWAITWDGQALVRTGITRNDVYGRQWEMVESPDETSHLMQIAVGKNAVWALSREGKVYFRKGTCGDDIQGNVSSCLGSMWVEMVGEMSFLAVSPSDQVFAIDASGSNVYFRTGVTSTSLTGMTWQLVSLSENIQRLPRSAADDGSQTCEDGGKPRASSFTTSSSSSTFTVQDDTLSDVFVPSQSPEPLSMNGGGDQKKNSHGKDSVCSSTKAEAQDVNPSNLEGRERTQCHSSLHVEAISTILESSIEGNVSSLDETICDEHSASQVSSKNASTNHDQNVSADIVQEQIGSPGTTIANEHLNDVKFCNFIEDLTEVDRFLVEEQILNTRTVEVNSHVQSSLPISDPNQNVNFNSSLQNIDALAPHSSSPCLIEDKPCDSHDQPVSSSNLASVESSYSQLDDSTSQNTFCDNMRVKDDINSSLLSKEISSARIDTETKNNSNETKVVFKKKSRRPEGLLSEDFSDSIVYKVHKEKRKKNIKPKTDEKVGNCNDESVQSSTQKSNLHSEDQRKVEDKISDPSVKLDFPTEKSNCKYIIPSLSTPKEEVVNNMCQSSLSHEPLTHSIDNTTINCDIPYISEPVKKCDNPSSNTETVSCEPTVEVAVCMAKSELKVKELSVLETTQSRAQKNVPENITEPSASELSKGDKKSLDGLLNSPKLDVRRESLDSAESPVSDGIIDFVSYVDESDPEIDYPDSPLVKKIPFQKSVSVTDSVFSEKTGKTDSMTGSVVSFELRRDSSLYSDLSSPGEKPVTIVESLETVTASVSNRLTSELPLTQMIPLRPARKIFRYRHSPSPSFPSLSSVDGGQFGGSSQAKYAWRWLDVSALYIDNPASISWLTIKTKAIKKKPAISEKLRNDIMRQLKDRNKHEIHQFKNIEQAVKMSMWVKKAAMQIFVARKGGKWHPCNLEMEQSKTDSSTSCLTISYILKRRDKVLELNLNEVVCIRQSSDPDMQAAFNIYTSSDVKDPIMLHASSDAEATEWISLLCSVNAEQLNLNQPLPPGSLWSCTRQGDILVSPDNSCNLKPESYFWGQHGGHMRMVETGTCGITWGIGFDRIPYVYNGGYGGAVCTDLGMSSHLCEVTDFDRISVFENQTWFPVVGWCNKGVLNNNFHWITQTGKSVASQDAVKLPSPKWQWISNWTIDSSTPGGVNSEGWQFSTQLDGDFHPSQGLRDTYRRRQWVRNCRLTTQGPWTPAGSLILLDMSVQIDPTTPVLPSVVVWAVATNGDVLCRYGVSKDNPLGDSWEHVPTDLDQPFVSISVGGRWRVWGIASDGSTWYRSGVSPYNPTGKIWIQVTDIPSGNGILKQVSAGTLAVWAVDSEDTLWRRRNITETFPEGTDWEMMASKVKRVSVGHKDQVWIIANAKFNHCSEKDGVIYRRQGISEEKPEGTSWERIIGDGWYHACVRGLKDENFHKDSNF